MSLNSARVLGFKTAEYIIDLGVWDVCSIADHTCCQRACLEEAYIDANRVEC